MSYSNQSSRLGVAPGSNNPHTTNFPDPNGFRPGALRVWLNVRGGLVISIDSPREARLVLKTVLVISGCLNAQLSGLQQCTDDGVWQEWTDASGRRIHELDDQDLLFLPPSQEPHHCH